MRVVSWTVKDTKQQHPEVFLSEPRVGRRNWTTVLIGRNGTKKSILLRLLLEGALKHKSGFRQGAHPSIRPLLSFAGDAEVYGKVIAIAGTPFDRFPRKTLYQRPRTTTRFDIDGRYVYLGMKGANGTMGAAHSVRTLAYFLLQAVLYRRFVASSGRKVLDFLGLRHEVSLVLRRNSALNVSRRERGDGRVGDLSLQKFDLVVDSLLSQSAIEPLGEKNHLLLAQMLGEDRRLDTLERLVELPHSTTFSFEGDILTSPVEHQFFRADELLALIAGGLVTANHLLVKRNEDYDAKVLADSDLSSGQWHLMSSLLGLALAVEPGSMVLIDEPENSLHPDWQRAYIELLSRILAETEDCHTIIATHSPLIASGIEQDAGNVVQLARSEDGPIGIKANPVSVAYGWDASDVYQEVFGMETTRASSFIAQTDRALELIRDGLNDKESLAEVAAQLADVAQKLPDRDPMRMIVGAITRTAQANKGRQQ